VKLANVQDIVLRIFERQPFRFDARHHFPVNGCVKLLKIRLQPPEHFPVLTESVRMDFGYFAELLEILFLDGEFVADDVPHGTDPVFDFRGIGGVEVVVIRVQVVVVHAEREGNQACYGYKSNHCQNAEKTILFHFSIYFNFLQLVIKNLTKILGFKSIYFRIETALKLCKAASCKWGSG
jgi:hypothetical protein